MSIGVSIFLLVVGAILTFAVEVSASGFNINTVGIILMLAGALGLLLSLLFLEQLLAVEPSQDRGARRHRDRGAAHRARPA